MRWWLGAAMMLAGGFLLTSVGAAEDTPSWKELKEFYKYDSDDVLETSEKSKEEGDYLQFQITYSGFNGDTVPALFYRPKAKSKYPVIVLVHGLGSNKEQMIDRVGKLLAENGIAAFAIDAVYQKARLKEAGAAKDVKSLTQLFQTAVIDLRRAADYLKTREDVDMKRLGIGGYSFGSSVVVIAGAIDNRFKIVVSLLGGDTSRFRAELREPENKQIEYLITTSYAPNITPRFLLMVNGKSDPVITEEMAQKLFDAAKSPKELIWIEAKHEITADSMKEIVEKIKEKLK